MSSKKRTIFFVFIITSLLNTPVHTHQVLGFTPNDPIPFGDPWHLDAMKVKEVWDYGYDFRSKPGAVGLCIIGEPIINDQNGDLNITDKVSFAYNSTFNGFLPYPISYKGSHEASIASVAASTINNSIGVAGIVNAPLYSVFFWGEYPIDYTKALHQYFKQLVMTFDWCASGGKVIISLSIGISYNDSLITSNDPELLKYENKVKELYESSQALFFASSGNDPNYRIGSNQVPQSTPNVKLVGKLGRGNIYDSGSYGDQLFLIAPGVDVPAYDQQFDKYDNFGGSSTSAPLSAASAVLLWNQFPYAKNTDIEEALKWGATDMLSPGWDEKSGYGAINVSKSRTYLVENIPTTTSATITSKMNDTNSASIDTATNEAPFRLIPFLIVWMILPIIMIRKRILFS